MCIYVRIMVGMAQWFGEEGQSRCVSCLSLLESHVDKELEALAVKVVGASFYLDGGEAQDVGEVDAATEVVDAYLLAYLVAELIAEVESAESHGVFLLGKAVGLFGA